MSAQPTGVDAYDVAKNYFCSQYKGPLSTQHIQQLFNDTVRNTIVQQIRLLDPKEDVYHKHAILTPKEFAEQYEQLIGFLELDTCMSEEDFATSKRLMGSWVESCWTGLKLSLSEDEIIFIHRKSKARLPNATPSEINKTLIELRLDAAVSTDLGPAPAPVSVPAPAPAQQVEPRFIDRLVTLLRSYFIEEDEKNPPSSPKF